jgi:hypothetical protein
MFCLLREMEKDYNVRHILYNLAMQMFSILTITVIGLQREVFDFLRPLNESRAHYLLIMKQYRINEGIQYYFFFLYTMISITIGTSAVIFMISTILSINLHCCAIFKICR